MKQGFHIAFDWDSTIYDCHKDCPCMYPDSEECILELWRRGITLSILTRGVDKIQREKFTRCRTMNCFEGRIVIVNGRDVKINGLRELLSLVHWIPPSRTVLIGDTRSEEISAGKACGCWSVLIERPDRKYPILPASNKNEEEHFKISSLGELPDILMSIRKQLANTHREQRKHKSQQL